MFLALSGHIHKRRESRYDERCRERRAPPEMGGRALPDCRWFYEKEHLRGICEELPNHLKVIIVQVQVRPRVGAIVSDNGLAILRMAAPVGQARL